ncbi:2'-5' RNA ligase family protein [Pseudonocardia aurantiaca]|uniref:2'-5' RNA ligase family protein n=1 Tax=Pseudonocardia aurantiaca TaxID=75290 RepID=A0ABW4FDU3_9PSEU
MEHRLSALIVPVPEAEPLVGRLRAELDTAAALGVPAHVTVMFPFVPPADVDDKVLAVVQDVVAAVPAFEARFPRVEWFDEDVVWLAPEPAAPFVALAEGIRARFGLEPYEGAHGLKVIPHLTVGHRAPLPRMRTAAAELEPGLPLRAHVGSVRLMAGSDVAGSWTTVAEFSLP